MEKKARTKPRRWTVSVPIAGSFTVEVEAQDEEGAKEAAWKKIDDIGGVPEEVGEVEWEFHDKIVEGNVCHVRLTEVEVQEDK